VKKGHMPGGREASMNKAENREPKGGGHDAPRRGAAAARGNEHDHVGNERSPDMKGALMGNPTDHNPLHGAVKELHAQHPHHHDDLGPHHGKEHHVRHTPLHGMKPEGGHSKHHEKRH